MRTRRTLRDVETCGAAGGRVSLSTGYAPAAILAPVIDLTAEEARRLTEERRRELERELKALTEELVSRGATEVWVFGSFARGDIWPWSDLDVIAVMPSELPWLERMQKLYMELEHVEGDLLVYTPEEFERMRGRSFVERALEEGKRVWPT